MNDVCFLIVCNFWRDQNIFDTRYLVTESRATMGHDWSGPEFFLMLILGRVWLGQVM